MTTLIGSSLKLYFGRERTAVWSRAIVEIARHHPAVTQRGVEPFIVPSFLSIPEVVEIAEGTEVLVGAQDVYFDDGPYTGEVSASQLAEFGTALVEIGHAERRRLFGETDATVAKKVQASLAAGLTPLVCIGEVDEGEPADAARACVAQLAASIGPAFDEGLSGRVVVAYEPVWAIGASQPAGETHIRTVSAALRRALGDSNAADDSAVIYGGSAGPGLLPRIHPEVQGLFLGRFAHDPNAFATILDETLELD